MSAKGADAFLFAGIHFYGSFPVLIGGGSKMYAIIGVGAVQSAIGFQRC